MAGDPSAVSPDRSNPDRASLEIEKLSLENQKLRNELHALNTDFWKRVERLSPLLVTLLAVAGFLFGVIQYVGQQKATRKAAAEQTQRELEARARESQREIEARDREFMKPLWEKELDLYFRASDVVATIATTRDPSKRRVAEADFWKLYQGPLVIVENMDLSGAMKRFGRCLDGKNKCSEDDFLVRSRALASTIQETIEESARLRLSEFSKNKFQYHR